DVQPDRLDIDQDLYLRPRSTRARAGGRGRAQRSVAGWAARGSGGGRVVVRVLHHHGGIRHERPRGSRPPGRRTSGAGDGDRTRGLQLGKLTPYHSATPAMARTLGQNFRKCASCPLRLSAWEAGILPTELRPRSPAILASTLPKSNCPSGGPSHS